MVRRRAARFGHGARGNVHGLVRVCCPWRRLCTCGLVAIIVLILAIALSTVWRWSSMFMFTIMACCCSFIICRRRSCARTPACTAQNQTRASSFRGGPAFDALLSTEAERDVRARVFPSFLNSPPLSFGGFQALALSPLPPPAFSSQTPLGSFLLRHTQDSP